MRRLFAGLASSRDQRDAAEAEHAPIVPEIPAALLKAVGGKLIGFSADETSNNVLDALMMVDLRASPPPVLAGYLGEEGAAVFLAHHGAGPDLILQAC